MWIPRVRIHIESSLENKFYKMDEWVYFNKFKDKKLYYKFYENNDIEFIILGYNNRKTALIDGKILYFNVLFYGYKTFLNYIMGDFDYITWDCHPEYFKCSKEEFYENEEWFFCEKSGQRDFLGLQVEYADSIEKIDEFKNNNKITCEIMTVQDSEIDFMEEMKEIDYDCVYNNKNQKIFNLFHLVEEASDEIKILLLCQILETMGNNELKSDNAKGEIEKCKSIIKNSNLDRGEKDSILGGLEHLKSESSGKKIKKLLERYCKKEYKKFNKNKLVRDCYELRSDIIHGEEIEEDRDIFINAHHLKFVVLDTFKEWSKEN